MRDDDELLGLLGEALADDVPAPDPARVEALRRAVDARNDADAGAPQPAQPLPARRRIPTRLLAAAAVLVVAIVAGIGIVVAGDDEPSGEIEYAGPITGDAGNGTLSVVETGIGRVIEIDTVDLEILPTGEYYELWFVGPEDSPGSPDRISAGTFHPDPDGRSRVTFAAAVDPAEYPVVEVTSEPGDGDPGPSGTAVLRVEIP